MTLSPIGVVRSPVTAPLDDVWGDVTAVIELDPTKLGADATLGLDQFSHVEVIFHFDRLPESEVVTGTRHPRNRPEWPLVGILASRAKKRPNRIGVTTCRLVKVEGLRLTVRDLDAIDGTPVIDIKPYFEEFGPKGEIRQPQWSRELMAGYFGPFNSKDASKSS